ncbi:enoyl- hydratase isomerase family protein [Cystoisospora suis]|uniref:Enoyl-hydratase isomerase family protein n=1 Tax=Cystoisospora suis TaxID=483139 RepID=A0A2C6KXT9_9APIC|nr:enoyl- hydratase isomerase family protein [Cystoisospora suis]
MTGNDHNPQEMYKLQMQWNFSLFEYERMQALKQLRQNYQSTTPKMEVREEEKAEKKMKRERKDM